jgi:Family of unknown function (DUF6636)
VSGAFSDEPPESGVSRAATDCGPLDDPSPALHFVPVMRPSELSVTVALRRARGGALALDALAVGALTAAVLAAGVAGAAADSSFRTPSRHIYCIYTPQPALLRCDVNFETRFRHKPASCEFDWGRSVGLSKTGRARVLCVSDSTYSPHAQVIAYGTTRRFGPFTCTSRRTGLTCRSGKRHGFMLSVAQQRVF